MLTQSREHGTPCRRLVFVLTSGPSAHAVRERGAIPRVVSAHFAASGPGAAALRKRSMNAGSGESARARRNSTMAWSR